MYDKLHYIYLLQDNSTPLIIASESGNINVVNLLIGANADINRQTKVGLYPLWSFLKKCLEWEFFP